MIFVFDVKEYYKRYYISNRDEILSRSNARYKKKETRQHMDEYHKNYMERYKIEHKSQFLKTLALSQRKQYYSLRGFLFELLGNKCSNPDCLVLGGCTDIRCLQIDHINGGGTKEHKRFRSQVLMWRYYYNHTEEAKEKLQILCANCNWIKRHEKDEHCTRIHE